MSIEICIGIMIPFAGTALGSMILSLLKDKYNGKTISLVTEPVETGTANYEQRRKRRL